jgi:hypothetical protein
MGKISEYLPGFIRAALAFLHKSGRDLVITKLPERPNYAYYYKVILSGCGNLTVAVVGHGPSVTLVQFQVCPNQSSP